MERSMIKQNTKRLDKTMDKSRSNKKNQTIDKSIVDFALNKYLTSKLTDKGGKSATTKDINSSIIKVDNSKKKTEIKQSNETDGVSSLLSKKTPDNVKLL